MTTNEIKAMIEESSTHAQVCNVCFWYDRNYYNLIPMKSNDQLFLSAEEDDFILDGYTIRRLKDITNIKIKNDKCDEIIKAEKITDSLITPSVNIDDWETVFKGLSLLKNNIIVRKESRKKQI